MEAKAGELPCPTLKGQVMDRYAERGVSSSKEAVRAATAKLDKGLYPGAFCQLMPYGYKRIAIKHADGAGTKASLAYLAYKHGFPISLWRGVSQDSIVMNLDDAACVGALGRVIVLTQIINRNSFRITGEVISEIIAGTSDFCQRLMGRGFELIYAGGETADVPDLVRTLTVDNDIFTEVSRKDVVDASSIKAGNLIVGFSSTGQATWEDEPNSGIGSNGLTNARHDVLHPDYRIYTETYSPEMPTDKVYCGRYHLEDKMPGDERFTVASALLSPTRTYAPLIAKLLRTNRSGIRALIHCSGGGQTKIGKFGPPDVRYNKHNPLSVPPLFAFLQSVNSLPWRQMYSSYNMGWRLEAVVGSQRTAERCIEIAAACGIHADIVGTVQPRVGTDRVFINSPEHGFFKYP